MGDKSEQSEDSSSSSAWNVTTTKMLIQFYKENRILWDKGHKDYGHNYCVSAVRKFSGHAIFLRVSNLFPRLVNPVDKIFHWVSKL